MTIVNELKKIHKWLALLIVIQLLLWIISGILFSFIDHNKVKGNYLVNEKQEDVFNQQANFSKVINAYPGAIKIAQKRLLGKTIFQVTSNKNSIVVDSTSLEEIKLNKEHIAKLANEFYQGDGKIIQLMLVTERTDENRNIRMPSWQVVFSDQSNTHFYFSASAGEFQAVRTDSWRIFDFFMMLHFMDYFERDNFNHPYIIFFAMVLVFLSISGMLLVVSHFSTRDVLWLFSFISFSRKLAINIKGFDGSVRKIKTKNDRRLIDILSSENIKLPSNCAGGGICGKCKVKIVAEHNDLLNDYAQENAVRQLLSNEEIDQGYRLACQYYVDKNINIEIPMSVNN